MEEILFDQRFMFAPHKTITKTKAKQIGDNHATYFCERLKELVYKYKYFNRNYFSKPKLF